MPNYEQSERKMRGWCFSSFSTFFGSLDGDDLGVLSVSI